MVVVNDLRLPLEADAAKVAPEQARRVLGLAQGDILLAQLHRLSVDCRRAAPTQVCSVVLELNHPSAEEQLCARFSNVRVYSAPTLVPTQGRETLESRPVVVGLGPAGLFAAYLLSQYGYRPLVLERGQEMARRTDAVQTFFKTGALDSECNVQFGEGGAGTFSDGKLTTRINDPFCDYVLKTLVAHGAPADILYRAKPHIGTDRLREVISAMRRAIESAGGEVRFGVRLDDLESQSGVLRGCVADGVPLPTAALVLACGHSARDTFLMLQNCGLHLEPKAFSVGLRIEHLQREIDAALYGAHGGNPLLPPGEYALSQQVNGRGVYSFCMCPGGSVVAAASEEGGVVTNGMSAYARDGQNANSALCVSVDGRDFEGPLGGVEFQRALERAAFSAGGGAFCAPAQDATSFLRGGKGLAIGRVQPSYARGVAEADFGALLPDELAQCLQTGLRAFGKKLRGFDCPDAILTGIETRTSSPLRIKRDETTREALGMAGLYPCGEGAGYAGGIMSAAVDGLRTAMCIMERYRPLD